MSVITILDKTTKENPKTLEGGFYMDTDGELFHLLRDGCMVSCGGDEYNAFTLGYADDPDFNVACRKEFNTYTPVKVTIIVEDAE